MSSAGAAPQLGYCHTCDRQVSIDPVSYECNRCHGGFIEIFDLERQREPAANTPEPDQPRNFPDALPMFLQMLNSSMGMMGATTGFNPSQSSHDSTSQQNPVNMMRPPGTTTTRLQVILPTRSDEAGQDQFDLYGVINNVINDLLDPRRAHGNAPNTFHYQTPPIRIINLHSDARDYAWGAGGLDAIITQLLNQLENTGPPPASQDQLKNLPVITITQDHIDANAQCAICMEDFVLNEKVKKLPCKHLFHEACITEWLKLHGTCPVCRKNLSGEDTSQREYISRPPGAGSSEAPSEGAGSGPSAASTYDNNPARSAPRDPNPNRNNNSNFYDPDFD